MNSSGKSRGWKTIASGFAECHWSEQLTGNLFSGRAFTLDSRVFQSRKSQKEMTKFELSKAKIITWLFHCFFCTVSRKASGKVQYHVTHPPSKTTKIISCGSMMMMMILVYFKSASWITIQGPKPRPPYADPATTIVPTSHSLVHHQNFRKEKETKTIVDPYPKIRKQNPRKFPGIFYHHQKK